MPVGTYHIELTGPNPTCTEMGYLENWDWWRVAAMYGSYENYMVKVKASIDGMLKDRFITPQGAVRMRAQLLKPQ